jgi:hypothetical protein
MHNERMMSRNETIAANHTLIRTWIDDTSEHELSDRYVRTMLTGLVGRGRQGEPTPYTVRALAMSEKLAAKQATDDETRTLCEASSDVLRALSDKLHEIPAE